MLASGWTAPCSWQLTCFSLGAWEARLITKGGLPVGSEGFRSVNQGSLSFNHPLSAVATLLRCCDLAGNAYFQGIGTAFGLEVIT